MARQWMALGEDAAMWSFAALGPLGGEHTAAFLGEHLERWSHTRCLQALEQLRRIGSDAATAEIAALALRPGGHRPRREEARALLGQIAKARGLADAGRLLDRACPLAPTPRALDAQRWWLEALIVSGHRIAADDFRRCVIEHPVRLPLAQTLVWGEFVGARLVRAFRVGEGGELFGGAGGPYQLEQVGAKGHGVGLVHPAELEPRELDAIRAAFAGVRQAVPQLERPVYRLDDDERRRDKLTRFAARRVGFYALRDALAQRDWFVHDQDDGGGTEAFGRDFARDRVVAVARLGPTSGSIGEVIVRPRGTELGARRLGSLHDVTISELLWDLDAAHSRPAPVREAAPMPSAPMLPAPPAGSPPPAPLASSPPAPTIERAKSGRSKCVVCGAAIAKDSLRVGVERTIETPAFRGRATVWLHPQCRDGAPELEGATGLDELLR